MFSGTDNHFSISGSKLVTHIHSQDLGYDQDINSESSNVIRSLRKFLDKNTSTVNLSYEEAKTLESLLLTYREFLDYLYQSKLTKRARSLQARAGYLVSLAGASFLLGVIQFLSISFLAEAGALATLHGEPGTTLQKVIACFSFCGICFDALGGLFAILTFRSLLLAISSADNILQEKEDLDSNIGFALNAWTEKWGVGPSEPSSPVLKSTSIRPLPPRPSSPNNPGSSISIPMPYPTSSGSKTATDVLPKPTIDSGIKPYLQSTAFIDFTETCAKCHRQALALVHLIDDHLAVQADCHTLAFIVAGLIFFFVSLMTFIISSQPLSVWVSTTVIVGATYGYLQQNVIRQMPGLWRKSVRWIYVWVRRLRVDEPERAVHEP